MKNHCSLMMRIFILVLCCLILSISSAGCEEEYIKTEGSVSKSGSVNTAVEETGRENTPDKLPADLDYEGTTVNIYCRDNWIDEFYANESNDEIVNDALYERKTTVEDRLKVVINVTNIGDNYASADTIKNLTLTNSDECDIASLRMYEAFGLILENVYKNLYDCEKHYIDLTAPWWSQGLINASTVGNDKIYLLFGSIATSGVSRIQAVFFNKGIYEKYVDKNSDSLYQTVIDRKWTVDKLIEVSKQVHNDVNGNGKKDKSDIYGYGASACANQSASVNGVKIEFSRFNSNGIPELVLNNSHTVDAINKLYDAMWNNDGAYVSAPTQTGLDELTAKFSDGTLMFLNESVGELAYFRELNDDYGVLPMPMLDEDQGEYCTQISTGVSAFGIPISAYDPDMSCAVMEAMAAEGYRKVIPKYYETVLKKVYARDDYLSQMLDLLSDTIYFDFAFLYGQKFDNIGNFIPVNLLKRENAGFSSEYDKIDDVYNKALNEIIEAYSKL